jgi:FKBP-type peptidyl-prolyl cis-trans isomerase
MQLVGEGGKITLWVPFNLGYGPRAMSEDLPAYSTLVFEVELVKINKAVEEKDNKKK